MHGISIESRIGPTVAVEVSNGLRAKENDGFIRKVQGGTKLPAKFRSGASFQRLESIESRLSGDREASSGEAERDHLSARRIIHHGDYLRQVCEIPHGIREAFA